MIDGGAAGGEGCVHVNMKGTDCWGAPVEIMEMNLKQEVDFIFGDGSKRDYTVLESGRKEECLFL